MGSACRSMIEIVTTLATTSCVHSNILVLKLVHLSADRQPFLFKLLPFGWPRNASTEVLSACPETVHGEHTLC